ncbi:MAG: hypothetical protein GDA40_08565 [Rhodobacteraceae bacterium]|nr:hypothetical protein [Paracoccaceae bacterium]
MDKCVGEPRIVVHIHEAIRDPRLRQAAIEYADRAIGLKSFDAQSSIFDDTAGKCSVSDCHRKPVLPVFQPLFSVCDLDFRFQWHHCL